MARRVAIVVFAGSQSLDAVGPFEVFAGANEARQRRGERAEYRVELVGLERGAVRCESGLVLVPHDRLGAGRGPLDTLIVAGGAGARAAAEVPAVVRAVKRAAGGVRRIASVCTGAFVLAAAGLLDGRRATTHWAFCEALASAYPKVTVDRDPIFVRDGRAWTSAGVTAGIDLALAMVEEDLGRTVSMAIARQLVMFVRRAGGQSQFSPLLAGQTAERSPIRELQSFIAENPGERLSLPAMARRTAMSVRNFARVFRAEVGTSPAAYVEAVRLDTARRLLETTRSPVEEVARAAGFGTPESLRRALGRGVGLSPREYRGRFGKPEEEGHEDRHPAVRRAHRPGRHRALRGAGAPAGRRAHLRRPER
jgi:transcriptional regulator GlxA family with amidase domain